MDIITQIIGILKHEEATVVENERRLGIFLTKIITNFVTEAFERLDQEVTLPYLLKGYKVDKRAERTMTFSFGTVNFKRRKLVKSGESPIYPLDEFLKFPSRGQFSQGLMNTLAQVALLGVYRKSATAINLTSPFTVSHQTLQQLTVTLGKQIDEAQTADLAVPKVSEQPRQVPILYVEGDGVQIRQKGGGMLEFHRFQVCEGRRIVGNQKKRRELVGYHEFIDLERKKALAQLREYLFRTYDMSKVILVSNSDNGTGYGKKTFQSLLWGRHSVHEHFVDRYHVNKKIRERLGFTGDEDFIKLFQNKLYDYNWQVMKGLLDTAESLCTTADEEEKVEKLRKYLKRNWAYLKPFGKRQMLKGFDAVIGTCESNHRPYTYRMKKQGRYWSLEGALAMAKLIAAERNGEIESYSCFSFDRQTAPNDEQLLPVKKTRRARAKAPVYDESLRRNIPNEQFRANLNHWLDSRLSMV